MPASETKVATSARPAPSMLPIEGPSAWVGADMRGREAEWTYRLSPPEIVEIETAVKAVQHRSATRKLRHRSTPSPGPRVRSRGRTMRASEPGCAVRLTISQVAEVYGVPVGVIERILRQG
jgi:hypothetical protein